jgi:tRNA nucleotidyltransferase/poly(A) polymerase
MKESQQREYEFALSVYHKLKAAGYQSFFAGGAVRDQLMGVVPHDYDIATLAKPDEVLQLFPGSLEVGKKFGVIIVVKGDLQIEVTTFRKDQAYLDGRHPEAVIYSDAEEDARRRDFTMNALFWDPVCNQIVDYVAGKKDLEQKLIKAVGNPTERFKEDHLRMLRAIRFVSQLGFAIESQTWQAIQNNISLIKNVSRERIFQELSKMLTGKDIVKALKLCQEVHVFEIIFGGEYWRKIHWQDFKRRDQPWFYFWLAAIHVGLDKESLLKALSSLKTSQHWLQSLQKKLSWFIEKDKWSKSSLGELLELSFDEDYFYGLVEYVESQKLIESEKWKIFLLQSQRLGPQKPVPILKAKDLISKFSGPRLGEVLKQSYWAQLEGKIADLKTALDWLEKLS